ncbi:MAG: isocitrate/isopropylmalate dehydrogenase family protein [Thaumarchaeota archaeon]|nr:isocitrate/isopropylmalate dehydrogenase family protein [Candidatus Calditenuaceae archaeon]MDW8042494.1 isocitrate/isopropylmalate dehydrogenase family protein [Nitrososphaerota archaeon]
MYRIAVIPGDGIGPVVVREAKRVLERVADAWSLSLEFVDAPAGDAVLSERGVALPKDSFSKIRDSDACLKGPVGETARDVIVLLRRELDLYANLRPARTLKGVPSRFGNVDLLIVRENVEDLYKGIEDVGSDHAFSVAVYTRKGTERIARIACRYASQRAKKITVVDKANVLLSHRFFREVAAEVMRAHRGISYEFMYVDNAAYQLVVRPERFDVILTTNMFGDILSDEAAGVCGTLGVAPSANVGDRYGLFEPVHGSAPDIDPETANPTAMILAAGMMLTWLGESRTDGKALAAGREVERALESTLEEGRVKTRDLGGSATAARFTDEVISKISQRPG